jgi:hypothetical protein
MSDEFLRKQEEVYQNLSRAGQQVNNQLAKGFGALLALFIRMMLQHGGIYMEMFLRFNFGVGYFPLCFSLITTMMFGAGIYFSAETLFVSPATDPETLKTASGVLISSVILSIPWTIHCASILWRYSDTSGRASDSSGDAWLDVLNAWVQGRRGYTVNVLRWVLGWLCASEARRDFLGETIVGIGIAYLVGWVSFYHHVTVFLLFSLVLMQIKRAVRLNQAVKAERQRVDVQRRMEGWQARG